MVAVACWFAWRQAWAEVCSLHEDTALAKRRTRTISLVTIAEADVGIYKTLEMG